MTPWIVIAKPLGCISCWVSRWAQTRINHLGAGCGASCNKTHQVNTINIIQLESKNHTRMILAWDAEGPCNSSKLCTNNGGYVRSRTEFKSGMNSWRSSWSLCQSSTWESEVGLLMGAWQIWSRAVSKSAKCLVANLAPKDLLFSISHSPLTVTVNLEYF
jgi:hypothetical protein